MEWIFYAEVTALFPMGRFFFIGKLWRILETDFLFAKLFSEVKVSNNFFLTISDFLKLLETIKFVFWMEMNFWFHHFMMTHALESSLEPCCWIFRYKFPFMKVVFLKILFIFLGLKHSNLRPCIFRCISFACEKWWQFSSESDERFYFVRFPCELKKRRLRIEYHGSGCSLLAQNITRNFISYLAQMKQLKRCFNLCYYCGVFRLYSELIKMYAGQRAEVKSS